MKVTYGIIASEMTKESLNNTELFFEEVNDEDYAFYIEAYNILKQDVDFISDQIKEMIAIESDGGFYETADSSHLERPCWPTLWHLDNHFDELSESSKKYILDSGDEWDAESLRPLEYHFSLEIFGCELSSQVDCFEHKSSFPRHTKPDRLTYWLFTKLPSDLEKIKEIRFLYGVSRMVAINILLNIDQGMSQEQALLHVRSTTRSV